MWRFGVILLPINLTPGKVDSVVWDARAIRNCLSQTSAAAYLPPRSADFENPATRDVIHGERREQVGQFYARTDLRTSNNYRFDAKRIREMYAVCFVGKGAIPWQWRKTG